MSSGPIEDVLAIRELVEAFAIGIMRKDLELWGNTWAEDGFWQIPLRDQPAVGRGNIVAFLAEIMANNHFASVSSFPQDTVVEGDKAHGKAFCQEMIFPKAGGQRILVGCFDDKYIKRDGRWYFQSRVYDRLWRSSIPPES